MSKASLWPLLSLKGPCGRQVIVVEKGEHAPAESLSLLERESCSRLYEGASLLTTADAGAFPRSMYAR